jgi:hypothetical protein
MEITILESLLTGRQACTFCHRESIVASGVHLFVDGEKYLCDECGFQNVAPVKMRELRQRREDFENELINSIAEENISRAAAPDVGMNGLFVGDLNFNLMWRCAEYTSQGGHVTSGPSGGEFLSHIIKDDAGALTVIRMASVLAYHVIPYESDGNKNELERRMVSSVREIGACIVNEDWESFAACMAEGFSSLREISSKYGCNNENQSKFEASIIAADAQISLAMSMLDAVEHYVKVLRMKDGKRTWDRAMFEAPPIQSMIMAPIEYNPFDEVEEAAEDRSPEQMRRFMRLVDPEPSADNDKDKPD